MFRDYPEAYSAALDIANTEQRDVGIERNTAFDYTLYMVRRLPCVENRFGHELRVQVVCPTCTRERWLEMNAENEEVQA